MFTIQLCQVDPREPTRATANADKICRVLFTQSCGLSGQVYDIEPAITDWGTGYLTAMDSSKSKL